MPGTYWRARRTPLRTFVSKNRIQSSSEICSNGFGSKMPTLLTRMSTSGSRAVTARHPAAVARSAATPSADTPATSPRSLDSASSTRASVRPLRVTVAPSAASARAVAKPIPAVDPVTSALFPFKPSSMP